LIHKNDYVLNDKKVQLLNVPNISKKITPVKLRLFEHIEITFLNIKLPLILGLFHWVFSAK